MKRKEVRSRLRELGIRRRQLREDEEKLAVDTARELKNSQGLLSVTDAADLAGIHRSTAHDYLKG